MQVLERALVLLVVAAAALSGVAAGGAKCSKRGVSIAVHRAADVEKRLNYPNTELVTLVLWTNPGPLALVGDGYSCTVVRSATNRPVTVISGDRSPALYVEGARNVLVNGVNFRVNLRPNSRRGCPSVQATPNSKHITCPAVFLHDSHNVMLTQGSISGRVDLWGLMGSLLDSLRIQGYSFDGIVMRVGECGDGPRLIKSGLVISNNDISGSENAIWLMSGAVGVSIVNNYIHGFAFSGIRCGLGQHNVGDCMLSTFANNMLYTAPNEKKISDNTGIYFATHWVNPGNYLSCNYIIGGEHCLYLDWASSGITIDGGVCHLNRNGLKLNTGHSNKVSGLVISSPRGQSGWISCQNYWVNNCLSDPGTFWESKRNKLYNSPQFNKLFPWMKDFCSIRSIGGVSCNPRGSQPSWRTGRCSGLPTANQVSLTLVNVAANYNPGFRSCEGVTIIDQINSLKYNVVSGHHPNFTSVGDFGQGEDFGVPISSAVYKNEPNFKSCPKRKVGIQKVNPNSYYARL